MAVCVMWMNFFADCWQVYGKSCCWWLLTAQVHCKIQRGGRLPPYQVSFADWKWNWCAVHMLVGICWFSSWQNLSSNNFQLVIIFCLKKKKKRKKTSQMLNCDFFWGGFVNINHQQFLCERLPTGEISIQELLMMLNLCHTMLCAHSEVFSCSRICSMWHVLRSFAGRLQAHRRVCITFCFCRWKAFSQSDQGSWVEGKAEQTWRTHWFDWPLLFLLHFSHKFQTQKR